MLEGQSFTVYTDHRRLVTAFEQKSCKASPRKTRHLDYVFQFAPKIEYITDKGNIPEVFFVKN